MDLKRSYQWLMEPSDSELLSNKRQVVENDAHNNSSSWGNSLVPIVPTHLNDCLFDPAQQTSNLLGRIVSPAIDGQRIEKQCSNVSSIGLPVVRTVTASSSGLDTIGKVNVSDVSAFGYMPESMVQISGEGISRSFEMCPSYNSSQDSSLTLGCSNFDKSFILPGPFTSKADGNFIQSFSNDSVGVGVVPMSGIYGKGDGNALSTFHPFEKGVENFVLMGQSLQKADCNIFSMSPSYNKGHESFLSCDKAPQNPYMTESYHLKENANMLSRGRSPYTERGERAFAVSSQAKVDPNNARTSHGDRSQSISFHSSVGVINSYENFSHAPATSNDHLLMEGAENISFNSRHSPYDCPRVDTLVVPKSKDSKTAKKGSTNTFPTNVKSLLSTGIFDGVTVKYYSWSREKNLRGIIKGTGYRCGCGNCNFDKVLNAYEFEQHANCKTKHPNNHIYFENGKTIYGVAQELKHTPQEKLFDAIQNVTGSDINHKNFNTWKASYQVASLELQRIYGKC